MVVVLMTCWRPQWDCRVEIVFSRVPCLGELPLERGTCDEIMATARAPLLLLLCRHHLHAFSSRSLRLLTSNLYSFAPWIRSPSNQPLLRGPIAFRTYVKLSSSVPNNFPSSAHDAFAFASDPRRLPQHHRQRTSLVPRMSSSNCSTASRKSPTRSSISSNTAEDIFRLVQAAPEVETCGDTCRLRDFI